MTQPDDFSRLVARELYHDARRRWLPAWVTDAVLICASGVVLGVWCVVERWL